MDPELRAYLDDLRREIATKSDLVAMEARLTKSIEHRREDIDAFGADVLDLQRRVKRLERLGVAKKPKQ